MRCAEGPLPMELHVPLLPTALRHHVQQLCLVQPSRIPALPVEPAVWCVLDVMCGGADAAAMPGSTRLPMARQNRSVRNGMRHSLDGADLRQRRLLPVEPQGSVMRTWLRFQIRTKRRRMQRRRRMHVGCLNLDMRAELRRLSFANTVLARAVYMRLVRQHVPAEVRLFVPLAACLRSGPD